MRPPTTNVRTTRSCSPRPTATQHRYRKIHPFTYGGETKHFRAGDQFVTVDVEGLRVSLFVCYDLRFADEFWQLADDTDVYLVPANWPEARRLPWMALLQARAIENQAYVIGCNRVGSGNGLPTAATRIIDPLGELLASAAQTETHPARRHQRRACRRGPRPLPLPARPPIAGDRDIVSSLPRPFPT